MSIHKEDDGQKAVQTVTRVVRQLFPDRWVSVRPIGNPEEREIKVSLKNLSGDDRLALMAELGPLAGARLSFRDCKYSMNDLIGFLDIISQVKMERSLFQASGPSPDRQLVSLTLLRAAPGVIEAIHKAGVPSDALEVKYGIVGLG